MTGLILWFCGLKSQSLACQAIRRPNFNAVPDGDPVLPQGSRSGGRVHSKAVRLGLFESQMRQAGKFTSVSEDARTSLVRDMFGKLNAVATSCGMHISQNLVVFRAADGTMEPYDYTSRASQTRSRQNSVGVYSHVRAQRDALKNLLQEKPIKHAIVSRFYIACQSFSQMLNC